MDVVYKDYIISDNKNKMQFDKVTELLKDAYWSRKWSNDIIKISMDNSICFGVFYKETQIAFARCVTDNATMYWLCDVIVDREYRNS